MGRRLKGKHCGGIAYTTRADIERFHGKDWAERFFKAMGVGNTCPVLDGVSGIYMGDYKRFADVVDFGKATYFD